MTKQDQIDALEAELGTARETQRRMHRRLQLLEGFWQRKAGRAEALASVYRTLVVERDAGLLRRAVELQKLAFDAGVASVTERTTKRAKPDEAPR